ncbi:MAG: hypothetical protein IJ619_12190 [Eubacterium sp.]|nr:hypothetical protein [Eubacterium sp.]
MKLISIVGDSISTYEGFNPDGYAVFYDEYMQKANGLTSVYDTWWAKVNQALHGYLCVNNSYSGSRVTGNRFPAASSETRINSLNTAEHIPNIILVYIGFNDFGNGVPVNNANNRFDSNNPLVFEDAYDYMLRQIRNRYPNATVICGTLMRTVMKGRTDWNFPESFAGTYLEDYNNTIRAVVYKNNCYLADTSAKNYRYETLDGTHPTVNGHNTIARAWIECLYEVGIIL